MRPSRTRMVALATAARPVPSMRRKPVKARSCAPEGSATSRNAMAMPSVFMRATLSLLIAPGKSTMRLATALAFTFASAASSLGAQQATHTLWVTLGDSDQLVEVDPYTFRELRRIKVDEKVHGLAVSTDGSKV